MKGLVTKTTVKHCDCPLVCKHCGSHRRVGRNGHYCPTAACPWATGYPGCTLPRRYTSKYANR